MSELTIRLKKMLSQAQGFGAVAPMEAVARASEAAAEAQTALASAQGPERDEILSLLELAKARVDKYRARLKAWQVEVAARANLYQSQERNRLAQPIPPKL